MMETNDIFRRKTENNLVDNPLDNKFGLFGKKSVKNMLIKGVINKMKENSDEADQNLLGKLLRNFTGKRSMTQIHTLNNSGEEGFKLINPKYN
jgi:hypothetical protein